MIASALLQTAALSVLPVLSGELPAQVEPASVTRVVWVPAAGETAAFQRECALRLPRHWECAGGSAANTGVVVIHTGSGIGFVALELNRIISTGVATWGRLIRVVAAGEADEVSASALRIDRPAVRPNTRTLDVAPDDDTHVWPVSPTAFWVTGTSRQTDAFIRFEAKSSARHDEPLEGVAEDADAPLIVSLQARLALDGRVESSSGSAVSGALVDLATLRPNETGEPTPATLKNADVMRVAERRTDADGAFEFDGLESKLYKVVVVDFEHGRGEQWASATGPPLVIRLKAPSKATGRVLRQKLPAVGVKVRFVPDATAWRDSRDPSAHLTLDVSSDDEGRFVLVLPPVAEGAVQVTAPDGATRRIPLPHLTDVSEIALGDVVLDELIRVEIQTNVPGCIVSAVGPAGASGFSIVRARTTGIVHSLQLPEPGQWLVHVECGGVERRVTPSAIDVSAKGELSSHNLRVDE